MLKSKIFFQAFFFVLICFQSNYGQSQNKISTKVFIFNKSDIESIITNDNKEVKIQFLISGIENKDEAKIFKQNSSIFKLKIKYFSKDKSTASAVFKQNIDEFRILLEQNGISQIVANGFIIKSSNLITQEKAFTLSQHIIDVPAMQFLASYNTPDNLGHFEFNVYYFETKLFAEMHTYYTSLLNGYIDNLQERLKNAKEEKEEFIQNNSK